MSADIPQDAWHVSVYRWPTRVLAGLLVTISYVSLPAILFVLSTSNQLVMPKARMLFEAKVLLVLSLTPFLISRALRWIGTVRVDNEAEILVLASRGWRIEIPHASIAGVAPWVLPLPGAGFWLRLRSGKRFRFGIEPACIAEIPAALGPTTTQAALAHPTIAYGAAREKVRWRWYHLVVKFVLFPLVPGLLVFRLDQFITFGAPLGQYYLEGLQPYMKSMMIYVTMSLMDFILWAGLWRVLGECLAFPVTWLAPRRSATIRKTTEIACSLLYYGGNTFIYAYAFLG